MTSLRFAIESFSTILAENGQTEVTKMPAGWKNVVSISFWPLSSIKLCEAKQENDEETSYWLSAARKQLFRDLSFFFFSYFSPRFPRVRVKNSFSAGQSVHGPRIVAIICSWTTLVKFSSLMFKEAAVIVIITKEAYWSIETFCKNKTKQNKKTHLTGLVTQLAAPPFTIDSLTGIPLAFEKYALPIKINQILNGVRFVRVMKIDPFSKNLLRRIPSY